ncbi:hypothetical protein 162322316 [Organic Lake phycodnavirus 1]|jgi:hypothetical protein|nr:hypothetical protein 162322316 [Organic Lake phycodnavirus 1]
MSGTAALAAARRRRTNPQNVVSSPIRQNEQPKPDDAPTKILLSPNDVLKQHETKINVLLKDVQAIKEEKATPVTSDDIDFYKQKYTSLLGEITEIRTTMVKLQTFYMELNTKVDKLNNPEVKSS